MNFLYRKLNNLDSFKKMWIQTISLHVIVFRGPCYNKVVFLRSLVSKSINPPRNPPSGVLVNWCLGKEANWLALGTFRGVTTPILADFNVTSVMPSATRWHDGSSKPPNVPHLETYYRTLQPVFWRELWRAGPQCWHVCRHIIVLLFGYIPYCCQTRLKNVFYIVFPRKFNVSEYLYHLLF